MLRGASTTAVERFWLVLLIAAKPSPPASSASERSLARCGEIHPGSRLTVCEWLPLGVTAGRCLFLGSRSRCFKICSVQQAKCVVSGIGWALWLACAMEIKTRPSGSRRSFAFLCLLHGLKGTQYAHKSRVFSKYPGSIGLRQADGFGPSSLSHGCATAATDDAISPAACMCPIQFATTARSIAHQHSAVGVAVSTASLRR